MSKSPAPPVKYQKTNLSSLRPKSTRVAGFLAATSLPEVIFITSFILARWWQNSDFSYLSEIWIPIIIFSLIASAVYYLYRWVFKQRLTAHVAALLLSYSLYDFGHVQNFRLSQYWLKLLPHHFSTYFSRSLWLSLGLTAATALVAFGLQKILARSHTLRQLHLQRVLLFALLFLFVIQLAKVIDRYWDIRKELAYRYPVPSLKPAQAAKPDKPDIYYLEYEDYTNSDVLKSVYHYDETPFLNYLTSQGFVNRPSAYSNYPVTMSSIASTLALNYLPEFEDMFGQNNKWQTAFPYRAIIKDPALVQILKQHGYQFDMLSSWWDFTRTGIKADSNPTESYRLDFLKWHFYLSDLERDIVNRSVLSPWLKKGVTAGQTALVKYDLDNNPQEIFYKQQAALKRIAARSDKSRPHLIFGFYLLPHSPYVFNADGSITNYDVERNDNGADETIKYRNQVAFLNKQIEATVTYIKQHSANSVIVIQSDEGSYPKDFRYDLTPNHYYNPINLDLPKMRQKMGILASYYMPGVDPQVTANQLNSSVNAFRFVLNQYLGYNLSMLPDCHFAAGDKYSLYNYQLITDKLTGKPAPAACKQ